MTDQERIARLEAEVARLKGAAIITATIVRNLDLNKQQKEVFFAVNDDGVTPITLTAIPEELFTKLNELLLDKENADAMTAMAGALARLTAVLTGSKCNVQP